MATCLRNLASTKLSLNLPGFVGDPAAHPRLCLPRHRTLDPSPTQTRDTPIGLGTCNRSISRPRCTERLFQSTRRERRDPGRYRGTLLGSASSGSVARSSSSCAGRHVRKVDRSTRVRTIAQESSRRSRKTRPFPSWLVGERWTEFAIGVVRVECVRAATAVCPL
jgi:hypothetical protein